MVMKAQTALALAGLALVGIAFTSFNNNAQIGHDADVVNSNGLEENRGLLLWGSGEPKYNGKRGQEYCYNVNIGSGTMCCDGSYDVVEGGFKKGAVCFLEKSYTCTDLHNAVFVPDGEITMDTKMLGRRVFPTIATGSGFSINGDPSKGFVAAPFDYAIRSGKQNGLTTKLTSADSPRLNNKKFLVSGWDETQELSDHEIEWAGPSTIGLGGESFDTPAVIMKGGSGAMIYLDDQDGILHGSGYRTPINPEDGSNSPTREVEFCYESSSAASGSVFRDGDDKQNGKKDDDKKEDSKTEDKKEDSKTEDKKEDSKTEDKKEDSKTEDKKEDSKTDDKKDEDKGGKKEQTKVKICHGTASPTNPYVLIEVADDAASDNPGSLGGHINNPKHNDPEKNKNADILIGDEPPKFPGCKTNDQCQVCCPDQDCFGGKEEGRREEGRREEGTTRRRTTRRRTTRRRTTRRRTTRRRTTRRRTEEKKDEEKKDEEKKDEEKKDEEKKDEEKKDEEKKDDEKKDEEKEEEKEEEKKDEPTKPPPPDTPPSPGIKGDPHIKKWNGDQYDFHGGCDLVMVSNPDFNNGQGLSVHIRTKIEHWWSYIESAVIKIGDDTLEIKAGVDDRQFWVNGKQGHRFRASRNLPFTIGGFHGRFRAINRILTQFKLYLPNDQNIVIKSTKNILRVDMENCNEEDFGTSLGLMGTFGEGLMLGRDGRTVFEDPNEFGMEWQVHSSEPQLFHEAEGPQYPQKCQMPTSKTFLRHQEQDREARRLLVEGISREDAESACAIANKDEFNDCVFDVMATNDIDIAAAVYGSAQLYGNA
ncbi:expressed unknown protein [Seminavis robusta]|uniref:VWFD domain-containing protein n=1 Tax=Seminavis robusta TaxID=568900 RepID=A0A9N8DV70_9STRA|nr:expressed unknown protein [Seminavis robusta]|eukprot:Sro395_g134000.1 n/a (814) ;mRNA; r:14229-17278